MTGGRPRVGLRAVLAAVIFASAVHPGRPLPFHPAASMQHPPPAGVAGAGPGEGPPPGVHRFTPRARNAGAENLVVGLVTAGLAYLMLVSRGMERGGALAAALFTGLVAFALYSLRVRLKGLQSVEVTDEALVVGGRQGTRTLRWVDVERARHSYYGGDRWVFRARGGAALQLVLDGYTPEEAARINALIRDRLPQGAA